MPYVILASGIYLSAIALCLSTENLKSALLRGVPGIIGVGLMINGSKALGLI